MPKTKSGMTIWNLYVEPQDKLDYTLALAKCGKTRALSAGVRAFMKLYSTNETIRNEVNKVIDDFIVVKENGEPAVN